MKMVLSKALVLSGVLWLASVASAQSISVELTTDKPVYRAGTVGSVYIRVKNLSAQTVTLSGAAPWRIYNSGGQVVADLVWAGPLAPGQSREWAWTKRHMLTRNFVPTGTYTILSGPVIVGGTSRTLWRTIALTPSGNLAGTSRFPLWVGNTWTYQGAVANGPLVSRTIQVTALLQWWYRVTNLAGATRAAAMVGATYPSLLCSPTRSGSGADLFRFNRPLYYSYTVDFAPFPPGAKFSVGATNETVQTPAGRFTGCYRLDVQGSGILAPQFGSFWFAPGVGLVQYVNPWTDGSKMMRLRYAKVRGSDGAWYTVSGN